MNQNSQTRTGGGLSISASNLAFTLLLLTLLLTLGGCNLLNADKRNTIDDLQTQVSTVQEQVAATHITVADMQSERDAEAGVLQEQLESIDKRLARLPRVIAKICPEVPADAENCPTANTPVVIKDSGKMVVGELERVWIDPPGIEIVARIDTGASSSSVHAANLAEFERDGEEWVRFEWQLKERTITTERPVVRYVRVIQQADPTGTRRPVVNMRVKVGDVEDSFDFTLADRAHLEYQIILGRNFLTDVALVDVGQQFVQPSHRPPAPKQVAPKS
jgi:hypothetical protein